MDFTRWLQTRLAIHGHGLRIDGDFGSQTRAALVAFQAKNGIKASGVADAATIAALRRNPDDEVKAGEPKVVPAPAETMPPWMAEMHRRKGLHEGRDNAELRDWLAAGKALGNPAKLPWCGDAVETSIVKTLAGEVVPSNPFWAQAWAGFGVDAKGPKVGAVGVIKWSKTAGHVGFVAAHDEKKKRVLLLGGNQSNAITLAWFPLSKFIAFRWPKSFPIKTYAPLTGAAGSGSASGTR